MPTFEAMRMAQERGLDLVEVAPTAIPPVCRLMDYGRFKYEQTKKERDARKNQKIVELKEVRLTPRTDEHDIVAKAKLIQKFIDEGDKVKVTIRFRGRELAHPQLGRQVLEEISNTLKATAAVERPPLMEGRAMFMILTPPGLRSAPSGPPRPAPQGPPGVSPQGGPPPGPPRPPGPPQQGGPRPPGPMPNAGPRPAPAGMGPRPDGPPRPMPPRPVPAGNPAPGAPPPAPPQRAP
jgi:translation initiation factor IF-3